MKKNEGLQLPSVSQCSSKILTPKDIRSANESVVKCLNKPSVSKVLSREKYNAYTPEQRAQVGKYAAENGPARAARHFSTLWNMTVPESSVRRLKTEYLQKVKEVSVKCEENEAPVVASLPTKPQGRPLMLGKTLDTTVQEYITALRAAGGVVNTSICMAAAEGIVISHDQGLLVKHGGYILITKSWARSILTSMGYVKRKCSNAGKVSVPHFDELKADFLADIQSEVVMNEIPPDLIINWDQTALQFVPAGQWTMHKSGEKIVPIKHSDDKRQVTAVLSITMSGLRRVSTSTSDLQRENRSLPS